MWIDFSEIPPAKQPSRDTEAFEKFAKQFLESIEGCTIEKTVGRGADGGVDLIAVKEGVRWLVSCKHYLSTSITAAAEEDPKGRLEAHGCQVFIGFYSGSPHNSLIARLEGLERNHATFKYEIFNNEDIEGRLFSAQNAKGWILSARWFPNSCARLFHQLVHPVDHFTHDHLIIDDTKGKLWAGDLPVAIHYYSEEGKKSAAKSAIMSANEYATSRAFDGIFVQRVALVANLLPGTFLRLRFVKDDLARSFEIIPSWDFSIIGRYLAEGRMRLRGFYNLLTVWSFWDVERAAPFVEAARMLWSLRDESGAIKPLSTIEEVSEAYEEENGVGTAKNGSQWTGNVLRLGDLAGRGNTHERGFFAGLLCFCPGSLQFTLDKYSTIVRMARELNEVTELETRIAQVVSQLSGEDRSYFLGHDVSLVEQLKSISIIDMGHEKYMPQIRAGMKCFAVNPLEIWLPKISDPGAVSNIFLA